jgi:hypothetical protein
LLAVGAEAGRVLFLGNFHAVLAGRVYRRAQPSPATLERLVRTHGIRTVVNLRGGCAPKPWYLDQSRVTHRLGICQEDVCLSAGRLPSVHEVRRLVEVFDHADHPLLLHCHRGADRTGLAAAAYLLLHTDTPLANARRQLGPRYGHVAIGRPAQLGRFFDLYEEWLRGRGQGHTPAAFRRWAEQEYTPANCLCRVEPLDVPREIPYDAVALRVRFHNTSVRTWQLRPGSNAGVHAHYVVRDDRYRTFYQGRAGLFRADVAPGGSIDLTLALPILYRPGRYHLFVDMVDEQHCDFFQTGSDPLEQEMVGREQETAPGPEPAAADAGGLADRLAPGR